MTVKELIEKLSKFPQDAMVSVASFETGGFNELIDVQQLDLVLNNPILRGSNFHEANWHEVAQGRNFVAICVGPLSPGKLKISKDQTLG